MPTIRLPQLTRTQWLLVGGLVVLLLGVLLVTLSAYQRHRDLEVSCQGTSCPGIETTPLASETPTATPDRRSGALLDGTLQEPGFENLRPLAVIIENHPDARPQAGLASAGLVYEAIAEGGITRFLAVYTNPTANIKVGPIRSARTYFVDFVTELNAFFAHVGGNMDALDQIKATNIADLDQFGIGSPTYRREPRGGVATEHTMFSTTDKLWEVATTTRKWPKEATFSAWNFTDDAPESARGTTATTTVNFSSAQFAVQWTYNPTTNLYSRSMAGKPHLDAVNSTPITAKNIVLQTVQSRPTVTRINESGQIFTLTGNGKAVILQNGQKISATWKKEGTNRTRYYDENNQEISFIRGTTWVEIVHPDTSITY